MKTKNIKIFAVIVSAIILTIITSYKYHTEPKFQKIVDPIIIKFNKKLSNKNEKQDIEKNKELKDY